MTRRLALIVLAVAWFAVQTEAAERYAAPNGKTDASGTKDSPWDLQSALSGRMKIAPGDTLWLLPGTYKHPNRKLGSQGYEVRLAGTKEKPIHVRGTPGTRVTIDGALTVVAPSDYLWVRDLELIISENFTMSRTIKDTGSSPGDYGRPWGGLNVNAGRECKYINLVIHDNAQGISLWSGAVDTEVYGCIIYDNGWKAPDRGHGHAIYTQNQNGVKTISDCIIARGYTFSMHAYGSKKAFVDNYVIENNICYNDGPFLIGGDSPSHNCKALNNCLHNVPMWVGYYGKGSQDCEVRGNVLTNAGLEMRNYVSGVVENNLIVNGDVKQTDCADLKLDNNTVVPAADAAKREPLAVLRPNKYDATRANLAICNWPRGPSVTVEASAFLKDGEAYELRDPLHFYEAAVHWGFCKDGKITVPMYGEEFAAFVMFKVKI
jgi:hypothetical protein